MNFIFVTVSADDMLAGPARTKACPLGLAGRSLWWWALRTATARAALSRGGGTNTIDNAILEFVSARTGALVVGRRTADAMRTARLAWWPASLPIIIVSGSGSLSSTAHEFPQFQTVPNGLPAALAQATTLAADKDVWILGGATLIAACLASDVVDEALVSQVSLALPSGLPLPRNWVRSPLAVGVATSQTPGRATHFRYNLKERGVL